jgi:hypothetical protein
MFLPSLLVILSPGSWGGVGSAGDFDDSHGLLAAFGNHLPPKEVESFSFLFRRVTLTWEPSRLQRGPYTGRGAKPTGLVSGRTRLPSSHSHNFPKLFSKNSLVFFICSSISELKCLAPICQSSVV